VEPLPEAEAGTTPKSLRQGEFTPTNQLLAYPLGLPDCDYYLGYCGTAFALAPPLEPGDLWKATYLHAFKGSAGGEGSAPEAGLAIGQSGVLYGTTAYRGSGNSSLEGCSPARKSERVTVPWMPGNAGGGKDPCFRCVFEEGEER
jgi:hypothetical protein